MDNKQFPEQEETPVIPEEQVPFPADTEPEAAASEDIISAEAEISAAPEEISEAAPAAEIVPEEAETPAVPEEISEAAPAAEILPQEELPPVSEEAAAVQENPFDLSILEDPELDAPEQTQVIEAPQEIFRDQEFEETFGDGKEFDEIFNAPPAEEEPKVFNRPAHKGRPKRRHGEFLFGIPQIAVTCVWLALILVIGVTLGRMLWACAADVLAFGRADREVTITIYESDTMEDITDKLHNAGLIRYKGLFNLYASISDAEEDIKPGIYDLNALYDYHALVNFMTPSSSRSVVEDLMIPEGYTCRQIFELLEENKICTVQDISAYAASGELDDYWFLEGVERGDPYCLEGFLFPDTYDFYKNSTPREVLEKMLDNFDHRFSEEMRAQIDALNANVTGGGYGVREIVIVASLIEKETSSNEESPKISSVIYNRLFNWGNNPPFLNIDATIVYALDGKTDLTREDLQIDHPYNTYKHTGLTPGPISNPGLASLKAALNPATTNYYYYVLDPSLGTHRFSTTYEEHQAIINSLE